MCKKQLETIAENTVYEIQTFTLCDGWINTWTDEEENPVVFANYGDAKKELDDFLQGLAEDIGEGLIEPYDMNDFRVYAVTNRA